MPWKPLTVPGIGESSTFPSASMTASIGPPPKPFSRSRPSYSTPSTREVLGRKSTTDSAIVGKDG